MSTPSETAPPPTVLTDVRGAIGVITLNRPKALNALTLDMVRLIDAALEEWEHDVAVGAVLLEGAGERGFCAGGDMRAVVEAAAAGDRLGETFWSEEYRLNARLARYPKPIVSLMDGVVMGGGIGLAGHVGFRVATERLVGAMPEVLIGFAPDVGGSYLLSRAPGQLGTHLALTAGRVGAADAILCGLADVMVPSEQLPALVEDLAGLEHPDARTINAVLDRHAVAAGEPPLAAERDWIDRAYGADTAEEIVQRLHATGTPGAQAAADAIAGASPTSVKVTLRELREAAALPDLEACLKLELGVAVTFLDVPDLAEGVRAALIDKDRSPRWSPPELAAVTDAIVDRHFA